MQPRLRIKFWGTRGLVSSPRPDTLKYGGNTSCIQVNYDDHIMLIDTGFGASNLGEILLTEMLKNPSTHLEVSIFYTHFHWDHTQGLPFFHPIYFPSTKVKIYSPLDTTIVKSNLDILFDGSYSPFSGIDSMPSQIEFIQIEQQQKIAHFNVDFTAVDHGRDLTNQVVVPTFAYRFDFENGESLAIVTDHEGRDSPCNSGVIDLCRNVDILVHDAQYLETEYQNHCGWGHSSVEQALANISASGAGLGILTHHDPARRDEQIDEIIKHINKSKKYRKLHVTFADEKNEFQTLSNLSKRKKVS